MIAIDGWFSSQNLAKADTATIEAVTGRRREDLPGAELRVMARLDAGAAEFLALRDWESFEEPGDGKNLRRRRRTPARTAQRARAA